jgi:arabinose-5-phosphate isomerase
MKPNLFPRPSREVELDYVQRAREVLQIESEGIDAVRQQLDDGFVRAIDLMVESLNRRGKLIVAGMGKSFHIGSKIAATLTSTGAPTVTLHPSEAMHGDLGIISEQDVLLALSYSGSTEELLHLLPVARRHGAKVIAITGVADSPLARDSDASLSIAVKREACPFNMAPTASTAAMLAMGDAIAMVLLEARGFSQEDYAKLHPGGAIGRSLLIRVHDVMRKEDRLATVGTNATVQDAILAMTRCRSGTVAVVDDDGRLEGVFTDGDLRRHLSPTRNITELPVESVMTRNPVTVRASDLAVDVLNVFAENNIDDLVVVDADQRVVGQVDSQDLPKLKIL